MSARTSAIYAYYHGPIWRQWAARSRAILRAAYPTTDGIEIYVHNWYSCSRDPDVSARAVALVARNWAAWRRIATRYEREYDRAEHLTHGATFRPLWCNYCKTGR